jgi:1,2-diacylglycerol 3-alpha-glucosyltransferase
MIAIIFDNYGPYLAARARAAAGMMPILAVELYGKSAEYAWTRDHTGESPEFVTLLPGIDSTHASARQIRRSLEEVFPKHQITAVAIPGWGYKGALVALQWCLSNRVPAIIMSESTAWDDARSGWKEWIKSQIVQLASGSLVGGTPHAEYIAHLGMPAIWVFTGYDAVDNEYFATASRKHRNAATPGIRPYFLSSNRFILKKNLFRLVEAYAAYAHGSGFRDQKTGVSDGHRPPLQCWDLCLLGDGEQKPALIAKCHELGLTVIESAPWEHDQGPRTTDATKSPDSSSLTPDSLASHSHSTPLATSGPARRTSPSASAHT